MKDAELGIKKDATDGANDMPNMALHRKQNMVQQ